MAKKIVAPPPPPRVQRITPEVITATEPTISAESIVRGAESDAAAAREDIARPIYTASSGIASIAQRPPSNTSIALARELFRSGNYDVTDAKLSEWAALIENQGLDSALSRWQATGARGTVSPEFVEAVGEMPEFQQISPEQARSIAEQFVIYGTTNVQSMKDLDDLTNYIQDFGVDAALTRLRDQGADIGLIREEVVPDDVARAFVDSLYAGSDYLKSNYNDWVQATKQKGIQATFDEWKSSGNKGGNISADQLTDFKTKATEGLQGLVEAKQNEFQTNIDKILAGEDLTPALGFDITPQALTDKLFRDAGLTISKSDPMYQQVLGTAEKYGPEVAVAYLNKVRSTYGQEPANVRAPREAFQANVPSVFQPQMEQPTINQPAQQPQTGLSALPGARTFVTAPERPVLTPRTQVLAPQGPAAGAGAPIQALTAEDFLSTLTPAQYAEAARAAALQEATGEPVAPFSTPVSTAAGGMKEGGLASVAKTLESKGRGEDSMLIHMSPNEIAGLQAMAQRMGGTLTINPDTGLPEADIFNRIGKGLKKIAQNPIARTAVAAFAAPYLPAIAGSTALTAGLLTGAGTMLGGGNFNQGLTSGLMAFGGAKALGATGYGQPGGYSIPGLPQPTAMNPNIGPEFGGIGATPDDIAGFTPSPVQEQLANIPAGGSAASQMAANNATGSTILGMKPETALLLGAVGSGLYAGKQERDMFEKQYDDYVADVAARKRRGLESFERSSMPTLVASGGLISLAKGGITYAEGGGTTGPSNEPRMVKGNGDGMSDSVPATIEGVQEARLANDEFVIPADVVADIGNGSSSAGAKQLYSMMDRVRKDRHGTTKQPPEINAMKLMPA